MESGYLTVEINEFNIALEKLPAKELVVRLDAEVVNGYDVFKWAGNGDTKFSTTTIKPSLQNADNVGEDESKSYNHIGGFNDLLLRTTYIDLNNEVINGLANATLKLKLVLINEANEAPATTKATKGAPVVAATPLEEVLVEVSVLLHSVLARNGASLSVTESLSELPSNGGEVSLHSTVIGTDSALSFTVAADNCLAEYVLGARFVQWQSARLTKPPPSWGLHAVDVIDPKAKVPPTAAELRAKYIENVARLSETQDKVATFSVSVGGGGEESAGEASETASIIQQMLPSLSLQGGRIAFDRAAATEMDAAEDLRTQASLWSVSWKESSVVFLHRSAARRLVQVAAREPTQAYLPVTVKKSPTTECMAIEGGELFATGLVDISALLAEDVRATDLAVRLQGSDLDEQSAAQFVLRCTCTQPLVLKSASKALAEKRGAPSKAAPGLSAQVLADKQVSTAGDQNTDALGHLREEITGAIERVAQEYLSLYPIAAGSSVKDGSGVPSGEDAAAAQKTLETRKVEFLNYLAANGIFHELRERLKGSVQQIIRDNYGARGRALGKSALMKTADMGGTSQTETQQQPSEDRVEALLGELYVFLMRECSVVLNGLFSDTLVDRAAEELGRSARVNDEEESAQQQLTRLSNQADDAAADGRHEAAEALHLECIHLVSSSASLGKNRQTVHNVHARYGEFLLSFAATVHVFRDRHSSAAAKTQDILQRAREALAAAVAADGSAWRVVLQYAGVLAECGQQEQAEQVLHQVLAAQLGDAHSLSTFQELDGYESERLSAADPLCYCVLAALFSLQGQPLRCRKALRLVCRSFEEGSHSPPVATHGSPRRTLVLALAEGALFLLSCSLLSLGHECLKLAQLSEDAVTAKASARGKVATTVPHIRHLLKRAQAVGLLLSQAESTGASGALAADVAAESEMVANSAADKLQGWLCAARAHAVTGNVGAEVESYLRAAEIFDASGDKDKAMPLDAFVRLGRLMLGAAQFDEALPLLLQGCSVYSSATLFQLVGVCFLRLERLEDAEEALCAANVLDNRSPEVWAQLCLLCLAVGSRRAEEADRALDQALRLGLSSAALLRSLATAYLAVDRLQTAEDLVRRALTREAADFQLTGSRPSAHTRRLLGDVLAGQNQAVRAITEYQAVIGADDADSAVKLAAAERCAALLGSIGRDDELRTLRSIMASLSAVTRAAVTPSSEETSFHLAEQ